MGFMFYLKHYNVLVAQWIERLVAVQKVAGSIPAKDTRCVWIWQESNQERGRENLSFPVEESIENRGFSKSAKRE